MGVCERDRGGPEHAVVFHYVCVWVVKGKKTDALRESRSFLCRIDPSCGLFFEDTELQRQNLL